MKQARPTQVPPPEAPATVERLRRDIDLGKTGDKVPFPDPAAAPLGTDDEAAGTPVTTAELHAESHALTPQPSSPPHSRRAIIVAAAIAGAAIVFIMAVAALG
ncbi:MULTISPECIES: hypothetical protein [Chelatococcus]|uniref:Uncharacterized protein n=1 Tax=Chelatococcus caeni TaxID=1348468 RepID=A0A840C205_9HYPH|nr:MULTISPECIES: hypothetical protein [Chelatococcus]ALA19183.1 hypothetical protein AL346_19405 [Chelatococcus sp. CO-6]MBB4016477.1 hypothetical protein [Chelatococcus caeni]